MLKRRRVGSKGKKMLRIGYKGKEVSYKVKSGKATKGRGKNLQNLYKCASSRFGSRLD